MKEVQLGELYYTKYMLETIEVEAIAFISDSHSSEDRGWDVAVRVQAQDTGKLFLRKISELWN